MKVIIIGGVAGGATCAARLRRLNENVEIILFEKGKYISFANCGLPYHIGGVIKERNNLLLFSPKNFKERFNVDVRTQQEVIEINRKKKRVLVRNGQNNKVYEEPYVKLVLAPGAIPKIIPIPGLPPEKMMTLRNMDDMDRIITQLTQNNIQTITVVGGGFIGLEIAENLHLRGCSIHLIEALPQVMGTIDYEMASLVHNHLRSKGIKCYLGKTIKHAREEQGKLKLVLSDSQEVETDFVIMSVGVIPDVSLAKKCQLKLGRFGGISVNKKMQTSDKNIYAAGDAVEIMNIITGKPALIPLAGPANKQARVIANNLNGIGDTYEGSVGTSITKIFDLNVGSTGLNTRTLKQLKFTFESVVIHGSNHAGYYPGASSISIKLFFHPKKGRIYGAQVVGGEGVDKRIDVLSSYIMRKGTIFDLTKFEQAYAPPFSSAKDPINIIGFVAENIIRGLVEKINFDQVETMYKKGALILDVRTSTEYNLKHIEGALNIPLHKLRDNLNQLPKDKPIIVHCQVGLRSYNACRILKAKGYKNVYNLSGGFKTFNSYIQDRHKETSLEQTGDDPDLKQM